MGWSSFFFLAVLARVENGECATRLYSLYARWREIYAWKLKFGFVLSSYLHYFPEGWSTETWTKCKTLGKEWMISKFS